MSEIEFCPMERIIHSLSGWLLSWSGGLTLPESGGTVFDLSHLHQSLIWPLLSAWGGLGSSTGFWCTDSKSHNSSPAVPHYLLQYR